MAKLVFLFFTVLVSVALAKPQLSTVLNSIEKINKAQTSWKAAVTEFSTLSDHEKKQKLGALKPSTNLKRTTVQVADNIPSEFDARTQWPECPSIASIKDQGGCGSCWAVSTAAAASDRLCIGSYGYTSLNLSAENLLSCCSSCVPVTGCEGGWPIEAWNYLKSTGICTGGAYKSNEGCQPYSIPPTGYSNEEEDTSTPECQCSCTNPDHDRAYSDDIWHGGAGYTLKNDVAQIQSDIMKNGPLVACFDAYEDIYHYQSGVYRHVDGKLLGGHAVRVIGWGTENGDDYWLIANSWNRSFGERGLLKIARGSDECGVEDTVSAGDFSSYSH